MGFGCLETPLENFMCADYIWKVAETHSRIFFWGEAITKVIDGVAFAKAFLKNVGSAISAKIRGRDCNCINRGPIWGEGSLCCSLIQVNDIWSHRGERDYKNWRIGSVNWEFWSATVAVTCNLKLFSVRFDFGFRVPSSSTSIHV